VFLKEFDEILIIDPDVEKKLIVIPGLVT